MPGPSNCPKCAGMMERGFVADQGYGTYAIGQWVEGAPVRSIWTGLKLRGRTKLEVETWRCRRCGFLESWAPEGPAGR